MIEYFLLRQSLGNSMRLNPWVLTGQWTGNRAHCLRFGMARNRVHKYPLWSLATRRLSAQSQLPALAPACVREAVLRWRPKVQSSRLLPGRPKAATCTNSRGSWPPEGGDCHSNFATKISERLATSLAIYLKRVRGNCARLLVCGVAE